MENVLYFDQNAFGKRLQEARRGKQMTQEELADILHVGKLHISRMERGVAACSLDLLVNISEVLEVNTDKLIKGAEAARHPDPADRTQKGKRHPNRTNYWK